MFRQLAVIALLATVALARPIENYDEIPEEYKSLIPKEVAEHLKGITAEEKAVLKDLAKDHAKFANEDQFLAALKEKSPSLHEKALKLHAIIKAKVDALGDEAKAFISKVIADGRQIHAAYLSGTKPSLPELKEKVKAHLAAFEALSPEAKEQFKGEFPILTSVFTNDKVQALIKTHLN